MPSISAPGWAITRQSWRVWSDVAAASEAAVASAFANGRVGEVSRLYRRDDLPEEDCWVRGPGWCLAYRRARLSHNIYYGKLSDVTLDIPRPIAEWRLRSSLP